MDTTSSSSWQQRIYELVTTAAAHHSGDGKEFSSSSSYDDYHDYDNNASSNNCNSQQQHNNCLATVTDGFCCAAQCQTGGENQPVLLIAIQWTRILILKVGRMYYVAPICLMVMPVLFGLLIGYAIGNRGRRRGSNSNSNSTVVKSSSSSALSRMKSNTLFAVYALVAKIWTFAYGVPSLSSSTDKEEASLLGKQQQTTSSNSVVIVSDNDNEKEDRVRSQLKSSAETERESGVDLACLPNHIAVIMDGNRRYGRKHHPTNPTQGHWDGSKTLVDFAKWCLAERVPILTVYAFSTDNWNRPPSEVAALMLIFTKYCDELRIEAKLRNIRIHVLSTESDKIPSQVKAGMKRMVDETAHCEGGLTLNICLSYGSRGEIVQACRQITQKVQRGDLAVNDVTEDVFQEHLLARTDPDLIIRTSGEYRLSNFLLWQLAYAELFFLPKTWPEMQKEDLLEVIRAFAGGRNRRFGK